MIPSPNWFTILGCHHYIWPNCSRGSVTHFWWQRSIWFGQWKWTTTSPVPSHSFRCWKLTGNRGIGIRSRSSNRKKVWVSCSSVCLFAHNCWNSGKVRNHVAALFGRAFLVCFPFLIFLVNDFFLWSFCFISLYSLLGYLPNDNSFGWRLAKRQNKKNKVTIRTFQNKKQLQKTKKKKKNEKYQRRYAAASAGEQTISQGGALAICICNREIFAPFHTTTSSSCSSGLTSALTRLPGQLPRPITQHEYRLRQNKSASTIAWFMTKACWAKEESDETAYIKYLSVS